MADPSKEDVPTGDTSSKNGGTSGSAGTAGNVGHNPSPAAPQVSALGETPHFKIAGTVYEDRTRARVSQAVVRAAGQHGEAPIIVADDDGDFSFDTLAPGTWTLTVLGEGNNSTKPVPIELGNADKTGITLAIHGPLGTVNQQMGRGFLIFTSVTLILLVTLYILLHFAFPSPSKPLSSELASLVKQAEDQANRATKLNENLALSNTLALMKSTLESTVADDPKLINAPVQTIITDTISQIQQLFSAGKKDDAIGQLRTLEAQVNTPRVQSFFWVEEPWRFIEILLWGMAGILTHLILRSGSYLRWGRFYEEGIFLHVALLVVMPLVALVIVFLLSLITFKITLTGGNALTLDLSDPRVLAAVSFLIGSRPFASWKLLQDAAARVDKPTDEKAPEPNNNKGTGP